MIPESFIHGFEGALIASLTALIVAGVRTWLKKRVKITGPAIEVLTEQAKQLLIQQRLVMMLVAQSKPILLALRGILDALKDKMNGDFERAHKAVCESIDSYDKTMRQIVAGECTPSEEKKP